MNGTLSIPGDYATGAIKAIPDPYYYAADDKLRRDSRISELLDMDAQGQEAEAQSGVSHQSGVNQLSAVLTNQQKIQQKTIAYQKQVDAAITNLVNIFNAHYFGPAWAFSAKEIKFLRANLAALNREYPGFVAQYNSYVSQFGSWGNAQL